jgi:dihydroorotate dehydrogenase
MDKHAVALPAWAALGFGFCEIGGVTCHAQPGNPAPRMFRAVSDRALVNRMGFNNPGAEVIARTLAGWREQRRWPPHPVGINLGKSKVTPLSEAAADYSASFRLLRPYADFFVVNVSSPNTPNLRDLQDKALLDSILVALQEENQEPAAPAERDISVPGRRSKSDSDDHAELGVVGKKPILVKVAPDLSYAALDQILELVDPRDLAGIVATNTSTSRPTSSDPQLQRVYAESGGLSGRPLRSRSTEVIRHLYRQSKGRVPIIGVGGIFSEADAWEKICAGATLLQVYTGLVYEGPGLARSIVGGLTARLQERGMSSLVEAVGSET